MKISFYNTCVALLIVSITWFVSGMDVLSALVISVVSFFMFFSVFIMSKKVLYTKIFTIQIGILTIVCIILFIQFLNYRGAFFQGTSYSFIKYNDYIKWLPNTTISEESIILFVAFISSILTYVSTSILFERKLIAIFALKFFAINAFLYILLGWYQNLNDIEIPYGYFLTQTQSFSAHYAENEAVAFAYMGIATTIALFLRKPSLPNSLWFFIAILEVYILMGTDARAGKIIAITILLVGGFLSVLSVIKSKYVRVGMIILCLCVVPSVIVYNYSDKIRDFGIVVKTEINNRFAIQSNALKIVKNRELNGIGLGAYKYEEIQIVSKNVDFLKKRFLINGHPHCDFLEYTIELGIVGTVPLLGVIILYLFELYKRRRTLGIANFFLAFALMMIFLHSCIEVFLHMTSAMILFVLFVVWIRSNLKESRRA